MDIKRFDMGSNLENDIRRPDSNRSNEGKYPFKYNGYAIRNYNRNNRTKMAEIAKIVFNYLGLTVFILGIFANLGNIISVTMGFVGIVWGVIRVLKLYEDYLIRKIERKNMENKKYQEDDQ